MQQLALFVMSTHFTHQHSLGQGAASDQLHIAVPWSSCSGCASCHLHCYQPPPALEQAHMPLASSHLNQLLSLISCKLLYLGAFAQFALTQAAICTAIYHAPVQWQVHISVF
jgi:hypothetical protein